MATVYLADDLKPELAAVVGAERFLAEIKMTANLQHPHILLLFDSGEAGGFPFYAMPYIEGETLRDRIDREKQLPVDEALGIVTAVAAALQTAHEQGVVHRDIKPGNILLSRGEPLVADFGIALAPDILFGPFSDGYDVGPDDQRFLMARDLTASASGATDQVLVLNLFKELQRRVPN
jgi:serine/threonine protein kinase